MRGGVWGRTWWWVASAVLVVLLGSTAGAVARPGDREVVRRVADVELEGGFALGALTREADGELVVAAADDEQQLGLLRLDARTTRPSSLTDAVALPGTDLAYPVTTGPTDDGGRVVVAQQGNDLVAVRPGVPGYGTNGVARVRVLGRDVVEAVVLSTGDVVAVLTAYERPRARFVHLRPDGTLDPALGPNGHAPLPGPLAACDAPELLAAGDGVLLACQDTARARAGLLVARLRPDGQLAPRSPVRRWARGASAFPRAVVRHRRRIVIGGGRDGRPFLHVVDDEGRPVRSSLPERPGFATRSARSVSALGVDGRGRLLVAASTAGFHVLLQRRRADGRLDRRFGRRGVAPADPCRRFLGEYAFPQAVEVDRSGRPVLHVSCVDDDDGDDSDRNSDAFLRLER